MPFSLVRFSTCVISKLYCLLMRRTVFGGIVSLVVIAAGLSLIGVPKASAAVPSEGFNIITSPLPIKLSTSPSKTVQTELRFKNQGDQPEGIKIGLMRFGASGEDGAPDLYDLSAKDAYTSWVTFSPSQLVAQPNVWNTVTMTIKVPANADLGYYLAVTFSPATTTDQKGAANLKGSAATLVLLNVNTGDEKRALDLVEFTTDKGLYEYLPASFSIKLRNNGNIYIAPTGDLFLLHNGKQIGALDFNDAGGSVLPQTNRIFHINWSDGFPVYKERLVDDKPIYDHHNKPEADLKWDFTQVNKLRIGRYTAKILVVYDDGKEDVPLEASVNFWVLPWKVILGLLVLVAVIGIGIFSFVRGVVRKGRSRTGGMRRGKR
jgi:hypothetical protein